MYVQKLHCSWFDHPFLKNHFPITSHQDIQRILDADINKITIDLSKGKDVAAEESLEPVPEPLQARTEEQSPHVEIGPPGETLEARVKHSKDLVSNASSVVTGIMTDVRSGGKIDLEIAGEVVSSITRTLSQNRHTLLGVSRLKTKDEYTFVHSVSVSALLAAFASGLGYSSKDVDEIALGGLLHDIGKALTPLEILNKPGRLTEEEFTTIKQHALLVQHELLQNQGLQPLSLEVITMHHERPDGNGYPLGRSGDELTEAARMSSIVDIYDALTSVRAYKEAWEPNFALKNMLAWCPDQLDRMLMEKFVKILGIYPVGSLVELSSGKVAMVSEQTESLLSPVVKVIFDMNSLSYIEPYELNLSDGSEDSIQLVIAPEKYGIEMSAHI